ncbi:MAG: hypothetical protein BGO70_00190 [Bacteroidetes bacterium 43-93]|nr:DUF4199 domain-containing protein [Bacteroidota bacterium]OJW96140.1 MAG: hypothetical protein BGO70_00190 [Bacteroidetes bacterium 43-93]
MKKVQTHVKYGLITGIVLIVLNLVWYITGLTFTTWAGYILLIPYLIGIILNANAYSKANNADVTFGQAFGSSFKASLIISVMAAVWTAIFITLFPEFIDKMLTMTSDRMAQKGMDEDQIEQGVAMTKKFMNMPWMATMAFIWDLFLGVIFSLIAGGVAKKNPQPQHIQ